MTILGGNDFVGDSLFVCMAFDPRVGYGAEGALGYDECKVVPDIPINAAVVVRLRVGVIGWVNMGLG